jgi:hypothetical protein
MSLDDSLNRNPTTGLLIARGDTILVEERLQALAEAGELTRPSLSKGDWTWKVKGLGLPPGTAARCSTRGRRGSSCPRVFPSWSRAGRAHPLARSVSPGGPTRRCRARHRRHGATGSKP